MNDLLSAADVAALLGVTPARVYQLIADNHLPSIRVAGRIRIPRAAWDEWLRRQTRAALANTEEAHHAHTK